MALFEEREQLWPAALTNMTNDSHLAKLKPSESKSTASNSSLYLPKIVAASIHVQGTYKKHNLIRKQTI